MKTTKNFFQTYVVIILLLVFSAFFIINSFFTDSLVTRVASIFFGVILLFLAGIIFGSKIESVLFKNKIVNNIPEDMELEAEGRDELSAEIIILTERKRFKETKLKGIYLRTNSFDTSKAKMKLEESSGFDPENFETLVGDELKKSEKE